MFSLSLWLSLSLSSGQLLGLGTNLGLILLASVSAMTSWFWPRPHLWLRESDLI